MSVSAWGDQSSPAQRPRVSRMPRDVAGQMEAGKARAENVGPEERLGFYGHADDPRESAWCKEPMKHHSTEAHVVCQADA